MPAHAYIHRSLSGSRAAYTAAAATSPPPGLVDDREGWFKTPVIVMGAEGDKWVTCCVTGLCEFGCLLREYMQLSKIGGKVDWYLSLKLHVFYTETQSHLCVHVHTNISHMLRCTSLACCSATVAASRGGRGKCPIVAAMGEWTQCNLYLVRCLLLSANSMFDRYWSEIEARADVEQHFFNRHICCNSQTCWP